jgi:curved DNA-binding protein CbpA
MANLNPFYVLKVFHTSTDEEVRNAYISLIREYPPDRSPEKFQEVREAFEEIKHERDRIKRYLAFPRTIDNLSDIIPDKKPERNLLPRSVWNKIIKNKRRV